MSACERPVTPSSTFSMLPSVTSFLRSADNQSGKEILAHAQRQKTAVPENSKEEKMETDSSAASENKKEKNDSRYLFEIDDSEVHKQVKQYIFFERLRLLDIKSIVS